MYRAGAKNTDRYAAQIMMMIEKASKI
jgi:hypothetical protein